MNFDLAEEQKMLAEQARGLLADLSPPDRLRELIDSGADWDESLWKAIAELGFLGARVPEAFGGLGLGNLDLGVISEEIGRAVAAIPMFSSLVCAADAIAAFGSESQKEKWLPVLADGSAIGVFAHAEGRDGWWPDNPSVSIEDGKISGIKTPVADAGIGHVVVVYCAFKGQPALAIADLSADKISRRKLKSFDQLRPHYLIEFLGAPAELLELSVGNATAIRALIDRISVQSTFEAVGGAEACVYMARDYALERKIFGRPLASYQAIKHNLANILVATEFTRSNAFYAGWAADNSPDELALAAASARLSAVGAYEQAARENLQVHGGIGYTYEANCHFHYRRERTLALTLGPRQYWADRVVANIPGRQLEAA